MSCEFLVEQFVEAMVDCRKLYVENSVQWYCGADGLGADARREFLAEVDFRFNRLLVKICVEVSFSDCIWSDGEAILADKLLQNLMRKPIRKRDLKKTLEDLYQIANEDSWQSVLEPFTMLEELSEHRAELEGALMRMANNVAYIDGQVTHETIGQLKNLKWQLHQFLTPPPQAPKPAESYKAVHHHKILPVPSPTPPSPTPLHGPSSIRAQSAVNKFEAFSESCPATGDGSGDPGTRNVRGQGGNLADVLAELDALIGIESVKQEVNGLVNFRTVQAHRKTAGLPMNPISLHMVFEGNPGTGKTTVARLLGRVFSAMGVFNKRHLVETDRSGLVAEYAGQTATKTNAIIDQALDGVLFIDEAYSLMSENGQDVLGAEARQILLKRAEDDRERLIVILAGYEQHTRHSIAETSVAISETAASNAYRVFEM